MESRDVMAVARAFIDTGWCGMVATAHAKRLILEMYDQMAEAITSGTAYSSPFE